MLKVQLRNFSKCSSRGNKICPNSFQCCCLFISCSFTAHLMAYLLHSFFISWFLCGLIMSIALLWNSRVIMSFIVLIRLSVSLDLCYIFTVPSGKYIRETPVVDRLNSDAPLVNIYSVVILESHQISCKCHQTII